jgi:hypothetical protein
MHAALLGIGSKINPILPEGPQLKMTTQVSFILLIAALSLIIASALDTTSVSTTLAHPSETSELLPRDLGISAPLQNRENFVKSSWTNEKISLWRIHLALELVKRPKLNERQVRILLDAISLSDSDFFATATPANNGKADAFQALKRRALTAFPRTEVADIFKETAGQKTEDDILKMYYDISALPVPERKASFRNASSNDKSNLWRTHLALFFVKRPELNEWQKAVVLAAMSLATPEYFEVRPGSPSWRTKVREPLSSLEEQILAAFSFEDAAKMFATLGDNTVAAKTAPTYADSFLLSSINYKQLSDTGPSKDGTRPYFVNQDRTRTGGTCTCSTQSDWCPISGYCHSTACTPTESGCGTFWTYSCDGACR